jgi:hypothetical protein
MNNVPSDKGIVPQFFIIGDCLEPRKAQEAIHEGLKELGYASHQIEKLQKEKIIEMPSAF